MSLSIEKLKRLEANLKKHKESYRKSIANHKDRIILLEQKNSKPKIRPSIKLNKKEIFLRKPKIHASLSNKTVLTDSTWEYVEIFLKSHNKTDALFFWRQARNFYEATKNLPIISKPLTAYYCFLNATKALLTLKGINYDTKHGVSGERIDGNFILQNEIVKLHPAGVVAGLGVYLKEQVVTGVSYNLKDILYNLPYIHRAYTLTYKRPELFIPILSPRFVFDKSRKKAWLEVKIEPEHANQNTFNKLIGYSVDPFYKNDDYCIVRRNKTFVWDTARGVPTKESITKLNSYHSNVRKGFRYIYSPNDLWYIKRADSRAQRGIIDKSCLVLTIAAMHRLSELSRYEPQTLDKHLNKEASWLLTEFITKSMYQFIDQISSEITGDDFRLTGFRD
ncbi:YaaC family protein [Acinetobacter baumannii]